MRCLAPVALFLSLATSFCCAQSRPAEGFKQSDLLGTVLSWLPEDTETVMGASGVFPLTDPNTSTDAQPIPYLRELTLRVQTMPLSLLVLHNGGLSDFIQGKSVALALEGSRRFRAPAGKGPMRFEGCEIVVFDEGVQLDWAEFRRQSARSGARFESIGDTEVAAFEERSGKDQWTTLAAFPRPNVLLLATDRDYLQTVLARMRAPSTSKSDARALPETLPEWKYVDTSAKVWGLRHYRLENAEGDPTSPFQDRAAVNVPDADAVGATFWFEPEQQMVVATYLSSNADADEIVALHLRPDMPGESGIRVTELAPGAVEATAGLPDLDHFYNLMFGLMALMGHAVYM